jgi:hypothetical protein
MLQGRTQITQRDCCVEHARGGCILSPGEVRASNQKGGLGGGGGDGMYSLRGAGILAVLGQDELVIFFSQVLITITSNILHSFLFIVSTGIQSTFVDQLFEVSHVNGMIFGVINDLNLAMLC